MPYKLEMIEGCNTQISSKLYVIMKPPQGTHFWSILFYNAPKMESKLTQGSKLFTQHLINEVCEEKFKIIIDWSGPAEYIFTVLNSMKIFMQSKWFDQNVSR